MAEEQAHAGQGENSQDSQGLAAWLIENVVRLRGERGMTQPDLARHMTAALGKRFDAQTVYRMEAGRRGVTVPEIDALALVLNVEPAELLERPQALRWRQGVEAHYRAARSSLAGVEAGAAEFSERLGLGDELAAEYRDDDMPGDVAGAEVWPTRPDPLGPLLVAAAAVTGRSVEQVRPAVEALAVELGLSR